MSRLLLVSDAWHPQINGVVRTLERTLEELERFGVHCQTLTPADYKTLPCPTYPEIRLALATPWGLYRRMEAANSELVHIATEGPLGILARRWCVDNGLRFTTSYHTRFPEYVAARFPVPLDWTYAWMRYFHGAAAACMVATPTLERDLAARGFTNLVRWKRGVDYGLFNPDHRRVLDLPRPIFGYVGRVAVEKNLGAFLELDLPGSKVVVGDGPAVADLQRRFPEVTFTGAKVGRELAEHFTSLDVFVFPSLTDTFGNVVIEALASGVPVAAFPVMGPIDVIADSGTGVLDTDLRKAALAALEIPRARCRTYALGFSWEASARNFLDNMLAAIGDVQPPLPLSAAAE
jgi:glycosyltransferase involved in cell wall biosynthesis